VLEQHTAECQAHQPGLAETELWLLLQARHQQGAAEGHLAETWSLLMLLCLDLQPGMPGVLHRAASRPADKELLGHRKHASNGCPQQAWNKG